MLCWGKCSLYILWGLSFLVLGCDEQDNVVQPLSEGPYFTSFSFKKSDNPGLKKGLELTIQNDSLITGFSPALPI